MAFLSDLSLLIPVGCETDLDCSFSEKCYSGTCHNPCQVGRPCAPTATCTTLNHTVECSCGPGHTGDPTLLCQSLHCTSNKECPTDQTCYRGACIDPCILAPKCRDGPSCLAQDHTCICAPPLVGDPYIKCSKPLTHECVTDMECDEGHGCVGKECKDLCSYMHPCGVGAVCRVVDTSQLRTVVCECPPGYIKNDHHECIKEEKEITGCQYDADCPVFHACIGNYCSDPCEKSCTTGAECQTINHRPICYCPPSHTGDGYDHCLPLQCTTDSDCSKESVCLKNKCTDTCKMADPCGTNAKCHITEHTTECTCEPGFTGDPHIACHAIHCSEDSSCPPTQSCTDNICVDHCLTINPCNTTQMCTVIDHQVKCSCPEGHTFTARGCVPLVSPLSCTSDQDCQLGEACLDGTCQDLCKKTPCGNQATCIAQLGHNLATVTCQCGPSMTGDPFRECIAIPSPGCTSHQDCPWNQMCLEGQCRDACKNNPCSPGATCRSIGHRAICTCTAGYQGDPLRLCTPGK